MRIHFPSLTRSLLTAYAYAWAILFVLAITHLKVRGLPSLIGLVLLAVALQHLVMIWWAPRNRFLRWWFYGPRQ